jgi:hypothetical protein
MSNLSIFKEGTVATSGKRELSDLAKSLASGGTTRRIQTNTNGTFKRIVNGEQIGNALRGEINVIIIAALPKVSRVFYKAAYDPDAKPTLPDCWSNLGDKPEAAASNQQGANCADCPMNIVGSGTNGKGRACRFQRRISVLVAGDPTGEIYQFNIPAKSLFGKGTGNVHPFESYKNYLIANNESPDSVVTNISYDLNADSMELLFTPLRNISDDEYEMVKAAQASPEAKQYTMLTVAQTDKVTKQPEPIAAPKPVVTRSDEPEEEMLEPVKRTTKRTEAPVMAQNNNLADVISAWGDDD